jgi:uncharacterized protein YdhG (YjbR/CyaY superfamily)
MATTTGVEDYLASVPSQARTALDRLRATIASALPGATETISYKILAYKLEGRMVVWCAGFREELGAQLEPYLSGKGTIRFDLDRKLPATLVKKIVKIRVRENAGSSRRKV